MQKGFTLIEMLVVVLIIGILATIALPQYQRSIERARAVQAREMLMALARAEQAYFLENGEYTGRFSLLNVEVPFTGTEKFDTSTNIQETRSNGQWSFQIYPHHNQQDGRPAVVIFAGKLTGPYKGAGFTVGLDTLQTRGSLILVCTEKKSRGVVFQKEPGSFCKSVLKGRPSYENSYYREYVIPN